ncbi:PREDICTED: uncharacterized protein LOC105563838 [Vollenhovia emeryi]|uniref:uncharacterized protein LOC105563838 n=1 Tax=Vollenhovia emeryi TaxID=411798 RepID=UPI0005F46875|nr:PREDICTED: uncharacterized protein LOC105563838 [Vollenhovia emeryi]
MDKDSRRKYTEMLCGLLHLLLIVGGATGLKDLKINVPPMVRSGDTVTLTCNYDLEGLPLYSIQWLFNDQEFYRFLPDRKSSPPYSTFNVSGIEVNVSKSNSHDVTLVNVSRNLTGIYKCEVSAGSPSYHTLIEKDKMEVVDAPKTDPVIRTEKERIAMGETLRVNCTSGKSRPAPRIQWKLNGNTEEKLFHERNYTTTHEDGTQSTVSLIEFKVIRSMFHKGYLQLRCTASIGEVYRKSADVEVSEDAPRIASITGESPPYGHRANGCAGQNWPWNGNRGAAITMAIVAATLFLMMTSLTMTVPPITNVLPRCEPTVSR